MARDQDIFTDKRRGYLANIPRSIGAHERGRIKEAVDQIVADIKRLPDYGAVELFRRLQDEPLRENKSERNEWDWLKDLVQHIQTLLPHLQRKRTGRNGERDRKIVRLHDVKRKTFGEIGILLNMSTDAIKRAYYRVKKEADRLAHLRRTNRSGPASALSEFVRAN